MSEDDFLHLTQAQFLALSKRYRERLQWDDILTAKLEAAFYNVHRDPESKPINATDLLLLRHDTKPKVLTTKDALRQVKEKLMQFKTWTTGKTIQNGRIKGKKRKK
jgi:hypothetical protein